MSKILDAIKGKPATAPATPDSTPKAKPSAAERLEKAAAILAAILLAISIVWVFMFAWDNVYTLFWVHLSAEPFTAMLAAGASVGMLAVLLMVTFGIRHNRMRGLATLYAAGWFAVVVALVAVKTLFDAAGSKDQNLIDLANSILDNAPWLVNAGSVLAAILAGICIAPVASMFGAAKHPADDMSEDEARARYAWNAGKLIISGASIGLAVLFGAQVIGINVFVAVLLGLVLDVGFIVALQKAESSASAGDHRHAGTWTKFVWVYGVLIALMAVETIPALAKLMGTPVDVPGITDNQFLHSLGRFAYIGAIGMGILTIVLTATSSIRQKRDATIGAQSAKSDPFTVKAAAAIDRQKQGMATLRKSLGWSDSKPTTDKPALPAGITLADDGTTEAEARKLVIGVVKPDSELMVGGKREPVKGKDYDTTGEVVNAPAKGWPTPEELAAHRKWIEDGQPGKSTRQ